MSLAILSDISSVLLEKILPNSVGAIVTGSVAILLWFLNQRRASYIEVRDVEHLSLVRVDRKIGERIEAKLDGVPVNNLSEFEVEIRNSSKEVISNIELCVTLDEGEELKDYRVAGAHAECQIASPMKLIIRIPFLNPYKGHSEVVNVFLLCTGVRPNYQVNGRGVGWSARRMTFRDTIAKKFLVLKGAWACTVLFLLTYFPVRYAFFPEIPLKDDFRGVNLLTSLYSSVSFLSAFFVVARVNAIALESAGVIFGIPILKGKHIRIMHKTDIS